MNDEVSNLEFQIVWENLLYQNIFEFSNQICIYFDFCDLENVNVSGYKVNLFI